jgi:uncharacterized repeat protein (TIGR04076 family)
MVTHDLHFAYRATPAIAHPAISAFLISERNNVEKIEIISRKLLSLHTSIKTSYIFMKHKVKVTVIDKKLYPELQKEYCADPDSGMCPCYNVGDEFIFERDEDNDHFWHGGLNTLVKTSADPDTVAGGPKIPHCSEAWDAISRYIYTGLQGGSIMKGWMKYENEMICCCSDGTRPVIFKVERIDEE